MFMNSVLAADEDERNKPRLTDPVSVARAILALIESGTYSDNLLAELTKRYYLDLDVYDEVLRVA